MKIRISNASVGGQIVPVEFCDNDKHDVADVLERQHVELDNYKVYLNGNPCSLTDRVKDGDLISVQKENSKSGK